MQIIKRCNAKRLNTLESSVDVVIFCDSTRIDYIKYWIHQSLYENGWPSGLRDILLPQGSMDRAQMRIIFFFLELYCFFLLELFRSIDYIYQYKTLNYNFQYMLNSVKRPLKYLWSTHIMFYQMLILCPKKS